MKRPMLTLATLALIAAPAFGQSTATKKTTVSKPAVAQTVSNGEVDVNAALMKCKLDAVCTIATGLLSDDGAQWWDDARKMLRANESTMSEKDAHELQKRFLPISVRHDEDNQDCWNSLMGLELIDIGPVPIQERKTKARVCADRYTVRAQAIVDAKNAAKDAAK